MESLSKMVKLEQNIDGFEGKVIGIKQAILGAVDTMYEKLEKKEINFTLEAFEDRLLYHNRKWTAEVFVNLLENAVKYIDRGGTISIRVKMVILLLEGEGFRQKAVMSYVKTGMEIYAVLQEPNVCNFCEYSINSVIAF